MAILITFVVTSLLEKDEAQHYMKVIIYTLTNQCMKMEAALTGNTQTFPVYSSRLPKVQNRLTELITVCTLIILCNCMSDSMNSLL